MPTELAELLVRRFGPEAYPALTDKLYMMLSQELAHIKGIGAEKYEFADAVMEKYRAAEDLLEEVHQINPAHKRVEALHGLIDQCLDTETPRSCRRGCNACCHLNVDITKDEASVLAFHWNGKNRDRLKKQSKTKDSYTYPITLGYKDAACVFLENGECSVYENRPVNCRVHHSVSEPDLCDAIKYPHGYVGLLTHRDAEYIKAVMYAKYECKNMASWLLKLK